MKVTFDKNVYELVVDPDKRGDIDIELRDNYQRLHDLIFLGKITPFISETILTYESLRKSDRQAVLSHMQPLIVESDGKHISIRPNPTIHPGQSFHDDIYLPKAIALGFRILPDRRLGKLLNPKVLPEWYHTPDEDFFVTGERYASVLTVLDDLQVGYSVYKRLIENESNTHLNLPRIVASYDGSMKKFSAALSERSDGDSVALHIAHQLDFFCTLDSGKNARHSVFSDDVCKILQELFGFRKGSPQELVAYFVKNE